MSPVPPADVPATVERRLRQRQSDLLDAVTAAAEGASKADDPPAALERLLRERGVLARLPAVLADLVEAVGRTPRATPVAAPPYVVVAGAGPILRATLADGRLVVTLRVFDVEPGPRYVRCDGVVVEAALRSSTRV